MRTAPTRTDKSQNKKALRIAAIVAVIAALIFGLWWLLRNDSLYSRDKKQVQDAVASVLTSVQTRGSVVYNDLKDQGCDDRNSVGLAVYVHCEIRGHKFAKNRGTLSTDLQFVDSTLKNLGFSPQTYGSENPQIREKALGGEATNAFLTYTGSNKDQNLTVNLSYYRADGGANDLYIKPLIDRSSIGAPQGDEYIYGIRVESSYFSCRGGSIFQLPCPTPPSAINKNPMEF